MGSNQNSAADTLNMPRKNTCLSRMGTDSQQFNESSFQSKLQSFKDKIKRLETQVTNSKLFLNMVIHDMRNPTNSIEFALRESLKLLQ